MARALRGYRVSERVRGPRTKEFRSNQLTIYTFSVRINHWTHKSVIESGCYNLNIVSIGEIFYKKKLIDKGRYFGARLLLRWIRPGAHLKQDQTCSGVLADLLHRCK